MKLCNGSDKGHSPLKRRKVKALGIRTNYLLIRQDSSLTAALQPLPTLFLTEFFVSFSISRSSFRQRRQLADLDQVRNERRKRQQNRNQATSGGEEGHQKNAERSLLLQMKRFKIKKKIRNECNVDFFPSSQKLFKFSFAVVIATNLWSSLCFRRSLFSNGFE